MFVEYEQYVYADGHRVTVDDGDSAIAWRCECGASGEASAWPLADVAIELHLPADVAWSLSDPDGWWEYGEREYGERE